MIRRFKPRQGAMGYGSQDGGRERCKDTDIERERDIYRGYTHTHTYMYILYLYRYLRIDYRMIDTWLGRWRDLDISNPSRAVMAYGSHDGGRERCKDTVRERVAT